MVSPSAPHLVVEKRLSCVAYCHRGLGSLVGGSLGRRLRVLESEVVDRPLFEAPYGLAFDPLNSQLWVSDKSRNALFRLSIQRRIHEENFGAWAVQERVEVPEVRCPCMLDYAAERGLLVGCYGIGHLWGAVMRFDGQVWQRLTAPDFRHKVTHCVWLPGGGYCFVTRRDSVLWVADELEAPPRALTLPGNRRLLSPESGPLSNLRLRYVQGLVYSRRRQALLVADASLGAIYEVNLKSSSYRVVCGRPTLSDSSFAARLQPGSGHGWLGAIRALAEDEEGQVLWLDGECGNLWRVAGEQRIELVGSALPEGCRLGVMGCGMITLPS